MAQKQACVLFEFEGQDPSELTIYPNEYLIVIQEECAEGWIKVQNTQAQIGLVPQAYIEVIATNATPAPASNSDYSVPAEYTQSSYEDFNSSDSDDDRSATARNPASYQSQVSSVYMKSDDLGGAPGVYSVNAKAGIVRKGFGRAFAKAGGEDFILGYDSTVKIPAYEAVIEDTGHGPRWKHMGPVFTCTISSCTKESKLKGIKSFIAYRITPSFTGIQVSRRYKHFDWLRKVLAVKFICLCIPPLPDKQVTGRYEEDFVETRRRQLEIWLNKLASHPVVSTSAVLQTFLTCTDDGKKWKAKKREAEKDPFQGPRFFYVVDTSSVEPIPWPNVSQQTNKLEQFVTELDKACKNMMDVLSQFNRKQTGSYAYQKDYARIGEAFSLMSHSLGMDPEENNTDLLACVSRTSESYQLIGNMFASQPQKDGDHLVDELFLLCGLTATMPDLVQLQRGACATATEAAKQQEIDKLKAVDKETIAKQASHVVITIRAEAALLAEQREQDLRRMLAEYLRGQRAFFEEVKQKLDYTIQFFEATDNSMLKHQL